MATTFGGTFTLDYHKTVVPGKWLAAAQETMLFGVPGHTFLEGERTSRAIPVEFWVYGAYATYTSIMAALDAIDSAVNTEQTLTVSGHSFGRCRFDGLAISVHPYYDPTHASYWTEGTAHFTQLVP